ncbi:MAG: hypothetical protein AAFO89_10065, partial [Planctomycetota bacterium]
MLGCIFAASGYALSCHAQPSETFSIVAIPDTQNYVDVNRPSSNLQFFEGMTAWVRDEVLGDNE